MSMALLSVWLRQGLLREGENTEQEQELHLSGVPRLCSSSCSSPWLQSLALVAKPALPKHDDAHIAPKKHLPECHCQLARTKLGESQWRDAPLHHISLEETRRKVPVSRLAPGTFCSHLGSILFRLQVFLTSSSFSS